MRRLHQYHQSHRHWIRLRHDRPPTHTRHPVPDHLPPRARHAVGELCRRLHRVPRSDRPRPRELRHLAGLVHADAQQVGGRPRQRHLGRLGQHGRRRDQPGHALRLQRHIQPARRHAPREGGPRVALLLPPACRALPRLGRCRAHRPRPARRRHQGSREDRGEAEGAWAHRAAHGGVQRQRVAPHHHLRHVLRRRAHAERGGLPVLPRLPRPRAAQGGPVRVALRPDEHLRPIARRPDLGLVQ
mmetsp:Transcript_2699/g.6711  ORF Transcript_2699/g.6711 Transcript_2699/m.6711 type:complete len:243 (-) Transcript_2699:545-1273(-)